MITRTELIVAVGVIACTFMAGFYTCHLMNEASLKKAADAAVVAAGQAAKARVDQETAAAATAQAKLLAAQQQTSALNAELLTTRTTIAALQETINHAPLDAPAPTPVAGKCPGNPLAGDDFGRLYDSAAEAQLPASTAGSDPHKG